MPPVNDQLGGGGHASPPRFDLAGLPELCEAPVQIVRPPSQDAKRQRPVRNIVLLGAGPSLLAAEIIRDLVRATSFVPVQIYSDYALPAFVGPDTLVIALSYSGVSEETIYAVADVSDKGAQMLAVTSGGHLRDIAMAQEAPCVILPSGIASSAGRVAVLVFAFWRNFLTIRQDAPLFGHNAEDDYVQAVALLRRQRDVFAAENSKTPHVAKQLAEILTNKIPIVLASPSLGTVARCWSQWMIAESGCQSYSGAFPAVEHDGLFNLSSDSLLRRWDSVVLLLRDRKDDQLMSARIDAARDRLHEAAPDLPIHEIYADGQSLFARVWTSLNLGAWVAEGMARVLNHGS